MIQIDIPMPKNCGECPICNEYLMCGVPCNGRGWGENDVSDYFTNGRPEWCPMKEQKAVPSELKLKMWNALYAEEDEYEKRFVGKEEHLNWFTVYRPWLQKGFDIAINAIAEWEGR